MGSNKAGFTLTPTEIRELAAKLGVSPTKKLGQNFVHDAGTVRKIVRIAQPVSAEVVLEVGPGLGSLTLGLLEQDVSVVAVEIDRTLADGLTQTVARKTGKTDRLRVVEGDALNIPIDEVTAGGTELPSLFVANLPYNVAVPIMFRMLAHLPTLRRMLIMVQKEVADRLVAEPGSRTYGAPTVKLSWYGTPQYAGLVGPNVFWPKPNVDSALVLLDIEGTNGTDELRESTFYLVDAAFQHRRKMLRSALRDALGPQTNAILKDADIDGRLRAEQLVVGDYLAIAKAAASSGWVAPERKI